MTADKAPPVRNEAWSRRREAARKYQPKRIRLLLVAEAPPSDDRYFYFEDVKTADVLFEEVCGVLFEAKPRRDKVPYLKELRRRGGFLIDLKPDAPRTKREPLAPYVLPLLLNLGTLGPEKVIVIKTDVYDAAFTAMEKAGLPVVSVRVPFPSTGQQTRFRQKFREALVRAGLEAMVRPLPASRAEGLEE